MGEVVERKATCVHCGIELSAEHIGICPFCGKEGKNLSLVLRDTIHLSSSLTWETRKEYYQKHKRVLGAVIAITILSPFLGFVLVGPLGVVVGLALGGLAYYLGPKAITKVIEIKRDHA
jgi:hypothetical protein